MAAKLTAFDAQAAVRVLACAVLMVAAALLPFGGAPVGGKGSGSLVLFDEGTDELSRLDPATLAEAAPPVSLGTDVSSWDIALSADGSTLVHTDRNGSRTYTVRDGATGEVRSTPDAGNWIVSPRLSVDGARLLANLMTDRLVWALIETATGARIATFEPPEGWVDPYATDPDLTRLYYLTIPTNAPQAGTEPSLTPELVAVDLITGAEIGRVLLPDVVAGAETLDEQPAGAREAMYHYSRPGLAVSEDGERVAVVRADRGGFTLVDAASLTIERTVTIRRDEGLARSFLRWLGVLPQSAAAKMGTGDVISAAFAPGGARLYVWGYHDEPEPEASRVVATGLGLMVLDAATGEVLAEGLADELIERLAASPDGSTLAVVTPASGKRLSAWVDDADVAEFDSPYAVSALDAGSLEVIAGRELAERPWIAIGR
jgi:hypothetical protein